MRTFYKLTNAEKVLANKENNHQIDNEISFIGTIWYKSGIESYTYCCGCSYIGNKMVLTAAHCLQGRIGPGNKSYVWINNFISKTYRMYHRQNKNSP